MWPICWGENKKINFKIPSNIQTLNLTIWLAEHCDWLKVVIVGQLVWWNVVIVQIISLVGRFIGRMISLIGCLIGQLPCWFSSKWMWLVHLYCWLIYLIRHLSKYHIFLLLLVPLNECEFLQMALIHQWDVQKKIYSYMRV